MKIKFNFGLWDAVQFVLNCVISMQVGALVGKLVVNMLEDTGAPPLVILLTALLALLASVIITAKALFRFDAWLDSKRGHKYRLQFLNLPRAWSIWLVDKSSTKNTPLSEIYYHGVFGMAFFRIKPRNGFAWVHRGKWYTSFRIWRFSVEFGKR